MAFRVLVIGGRGWCDYEHLRDTLNGAIANRLPNVELVTAGGPGVPALAARYARSRGLPLLPVPLDYVRHRVAAEERRARRLVELADAAVVVWEDVEPVREMVAQLHAKGVRVVVIGLVRPAQRASADPEPRLRLRGMLPD